MKQMPMIIFAVTDASLMDQLPDAKTIKEIKEIAKHTYKVTLKKT